MRQALNAGVRWRYLRTNPVADAGPNPVPRTEEFVLFTREEVDAIAADLGPIYGVGAENSVSLQSGIWRARLEFGSPHARSLDTSRLRRFLRRRHVVSGIRARA
jgi:hypothetical protein